MEGWGECGQGEGVGRHDPIDDIGAVGTNAISALGRFKWLSGDVRCTVVRIPDIITDDLRFDDNFAAGIHERVASAIGARKEYGIGAGGSE